MSDEPLPVTLDNIRKWDADMRGSDDRARHIALYYLATNLREVVEMLFAELAEARDNKDRLMIAAAASVKASMDEYKRGHADGVKSGREEGFEKAATELERLDCFGEWWEYAQAIRALKSPKPPIL